MEKKRSAGGARLLTSSAVAELRDSPNVKELIEAMHKREAEFARFSSDATPDRIARACQSCVTEMIDDEDLHLDNAAMDATAFAQTIFEIKGIPKKAPKRREFREVARSYALLSAGPPPLPRNAQGFSDLWEKAMEGEPRLSDVYPSSRIRTGESYIADHENPGGYLRVNTDPENIVRELNELVSFMEDESLLPEARASAGYASCMFTHPFNDGNGHTGRALMLFTMAPSYSLLTNVCFSRILAIRHNDLGDAVQELHEGSRTLAGFCEFALIILQDAHREAATLLKQV